MKWKITKGRERQQYDRYMFRKQRTQIVQTKFKIMAIVGLSVCSPHFDIIKKGNAKLQKLIWTLEDKICRGVDCF